MNMKISMSKCQFGFQELKALGHKVSGLSITIDQNKVAAVMNKPMPSNFKELQSFLGFAGYYRQHMKDFAKISGCLYKITSPNTAFEMTEERIKALNTLKGLLTSAPILMLPDSSKPFKLHVDASMEGLGTALHQIQIVDLDKLYHYLDGFNFQVITDCNALRSLLSMKTTNRIMLRWQIAIQEWRGSMTIVHREVNIHKNADGLSSWSLENNPDNPAWDGELAATIMSMFPMENSDSNPASWYNEDDNNKNLLTVRGILQRTFPCEDLINSLEDPWLSSFKENRFSLFDGLIYHRTKNTSVVTIWNPEHKQLFLQEFHDKITSGHFYYDRTIERIKTTAWWP
jgi:hypothetical protein